MAKIKLTVESNRTTLKDLRDWMIRQFNEEIDRRVNEKFNSIAANAHGIMDWIGEKIASMIRSQLRINNSQLTYSGDKEMRSKRALNNVNLTQSLGYTQSCFSLYELLDLMG